MHITVSQCLIPWVMFGMLPCVLGNLQLQKVHKESLSSAPVAGTTHLCDTRLIQPTSRAAGRALLNLLVLDVLKTEIYLGGV
jgi:hypothetical protein